MFPHLSSYHNRQKPCSYTCHSSTRQNHVSTPFTPLQDKTMFQHPSLFHKTKPCFYILHSSTRQNHVSTPFTPPQDKTMFPHMSPPPSPTIKSNHVLYPGRVLPYLGMVGGSAVMMSVLRISIQLGPYFMLHHNLNDPLFLQKNWFISITFSSRDSWT